MMGEVQYEGDTFKSRAELKKHKAKEKKIIDKGKKKEGFFRRVEKSVSGFAKRKKRKGSGVKIKYASFAKPRPVRRAAPRRAAPAQQQAMQPVGPQVMPDVARGQFHSQFDFMNRRKRI